VPIASHRVHASLAGNNARNPRHLEDLLACLSPASNVASNVGTSKQSTFSNAGHLAWFILDVVDQPDLAPFYRAHRDDGHPADDPKTLLGVLLYGYCIGVRSSRQLERRCHEDIAFRVLAANQTPTMSPSPASAPATNRPRRLPHPRCRPFRWWRLGAPARRSGSAMAARWTSRWR